VADQDNAVAIADRGRLRDDDVAVPSGEEPGGGGTFHQSPQKPGGRPGTDEPGGRAGRDLPIEGARPARPEDRRLAETGRQDPEGDARVAVPLPEDVAGQDPRVREHRP